MLLAAVAVATVVNMYATAESVPVSVLDNAKAQKLYAGFLQARPEICAEGSSYRPGRYRCGEATPSFSEVFKPGTIEYNLSSRVVGEEKRFDWEVLASRLAIAMAIALIAIGAILIWTRPAGLNQGIGPANATEVTTPVITASDPTETLRRLKLLHQKGLITQADYDAQRKKALDSMIGARPLG